MPYFDRSPPVQRHRVYNTALRISRHVAVVILGQVIAGSASGCSSTDTAHRVSEYLETVLLVFLSS